MTGHEVGLALLVAIPGSYRIAAYARAARQIGLRTVVVTHAHAAAVPPATTGIAVPFDDYPALERTVVNALPNDQIRLVLGLDDGCVEIAARLAARFGVVQNRPETAQLSARKDLARRNLADTGIPVPAFAVLPPDQHRLPDGVPCEPPWVVKPVDLSASRGVIRANDSHELQSAISRSRSIALAAGGSGTLLIERYIAGDEIAIDAILGPAGFRTLAIFDKPEPLTGPFFEESLYVTPTSLTASMQTRVQEILRHTCRELGIVTGPVHAEFRITADDAWILELATRTIGGDCGNIFQSLLPVSLERLVLENALGIEHRRTWSGAAGVCMLPVRERGVLRHVNGIAAAEKVPGITEVAISIREGYELTPWPEGCSYPGFVFAVGDRPENVRDALVTAAGLIDFNVAPVFPVSVGAAGV